MTAAELLAQLRPLSTPAPIVSDTTEHSLFWPAIAAATVLALCAAIVYWRSQAWRRQAQRELQEIEALAQASQDAFAWQRLSVLIRRLVLRADPTQASAQVGEPWLQTLDEIFDTPNFSNGVGRHLLDRPYRSATKSDRKALLDLTEQVRSRLPAMRSAAR